MDDNLTISIGHFSMASNFLHLVSNILMETVNQGNVHQLWTTPRSDIDKFYEEQTKWSDFRIMTPTLFLFFHGIELVLKGANYKIGNPKKKPSHNLASLFDEFKENYPLQHKLIAALDKYIYPTATNCPLIYNFNHSNNFDNSSNFYEALKYPYSKGLEKCYQHTEIRFLNDAGIPAYSDIVQDIFMIRAEIANIK